MKPGSRTFAVAVLATAMLTHAAPAAQDAGQSHDYRTFKTDGTVVYGAIGDSYSADLVMYLAGNQFMVMEDLIGDFRSRSSGIGDIYVETIPPGQILNSQILKQGQVNGKPTARNPDLYASVSLGHLKKLKSEGLMDDYMVYIHNKLELMVAKGNPKGIKGPKDLARDDLTQSHPNPITEGIFRFYGSAMLKDMGLYEKVTGNAECKSCWAIEGKTWFTQRHHRETPQRIEQGQADVGIVWASEVLHAVAEGRGVEGVAIPAPLNKSDKVNYAIGSLKTARNPGNAATFLGYLTSPEAQAIYERYGFVPATAEELSLRPIPSD